MSVGKSLAQLGKIVPKNSALFLCDMQEKFRPSIKYFNEIVFNSNRLLQAAKLLNVPVFCTEQYPKGIKSKLVMHNIPGICSMDLKKYKMCEWFVLHRIGKNCTGTGDRKCRCKGNRKDAIFYVP